MEGHDVAFGDEARQRDLRDAVLDIVDAELDIGIADKHSAPERFQDAHDLCTDMTVADDADCHFAELAAGQIRAIEVAAPFAATQSLMAAGDEPRLGEDGAERELRDRAGV